jgi:hypothetical protein
MILGIFLLYENTFRVDFLDDIFAGVWEVKDAVVVLDTLLVCLLNKVVWLAIEMQFVFVLHQSSVA